MIVGDRNADDQIFIAKSSIVRQRPQVGEGDALDVGRESSEAAGFILFVTFGPFKVKELSIDIADNDRVVFATVGEGKIADIGGVHGSRSRRSERGFGVITPHGKK